MPRKPPAAVRAALPRHPHRQERFSAIDGVSAATLDEIHRLERTRGRPGDVARDLAWWKRQVAETTSRKWRGLGSETDPYSPQGWYPCCESDSEGRWGLERTLQSLSRRGRRELASVVRAVDRRLLAATYGSPPNAPGWWEHRI